MCNSGCPVKAGVWIPVTALFLTELAHLWKLISGSDSICGLLQKGPLVHVCLLTLSLELNSENTRVPLSSSRDRQ